MIGTSEQWAWFACVFLVQWLLSFAWILVRWLYQCSQGKAFSQK